MTSETEALMTWIQVCLVVAALCATSFPVVWAFSRWWSTLLGRLLMLQAVAFAAAIDLTLVFHFVEISRDNIQTLFWVNAIVLGLIAISTLLLTVTVVRMNYIRRQKKGTKDERDAPGVRGPQRGSASR